jgi:hypothetical protein
MFKPGNCELDTLRKILTHQGCKHIRTKGGHDVWCRNDLLRPIVVQTHIDPVPGFVVQQIMRTLGLSRKDMDKILREI